MVSTPSGTSLAVNVAVIDAHNRVLLTRREDFEVWCLPGGTVEEGESLAAAAVREVSEETGLAVRLTKLVGIYSRPKLGGYHSLALFAAAHTDQALRLDPHEVVEAEWFAGDQLPADLLWGQRERILDALSGVGGSIVRSTDRERPAIWPRNRQDWYDQRDRAGTSRSKFYGQLLNALGDDTSDVEVEGRRTERDADRSR
jgi:ADP-ribose pyrophosphatase YjhB (NUDIX family)